MLYTDKDFQEVVPEALRKENFDVLMLNCGPNEISNMDTEAELSDVYINACKESVYKSAEKMINLAKSSLDSNPSLQKVVVVKCPPRYDNSIKQAFSPSLYLVFFFSISIRIFSSVQKFCFPPPQRFSLSISSLC